MYKMGTIQVLSLLCLMVCNGQGLEDVVPVNNKRISETKCDEYKQGAIEEVKRSPLLQQIFEISDGKCHYNDTSENVRLGEFPHMAAVGWPDPKNGYKYLCAGSLISPRFVLTTAICSTSSYKESKPTVVLLGVYSLDPAVKNDAEPIMMKIKEVHPHPDHTSKTGYNDIGLLELETDVVSQPQIRPACLWTKDDFGGHSKAIATGWSVLDGISQKDSKHLKRASISLLDKDQCDMKLQPLKSRWFSGLTSSQVCAGDLTGGMDTCQGDSGAPLQVTSDDNPCVAQVLGVTSFGSRHCGSGVPAVYTKVSSYLTWIESVVWPTIEVNN